jgi:hypothetical protein
MEQNLSWKTNRFSEYQEIPRTLWNAKVHYRFHKCQPPASISKKLHPVHNPISNFLKIYLFIILLSTPGSPNFSFTQNFPTNPCICLTGLPYTLLTRPHYILFKFITQTILGEGHRIISSSLRTFLHSIVISKLLNQKLSTECLIIKKYPAYLFTDPIMIFPFPAFIMTISNFICWNTVYISDFLVLLFYELF